MQKFNICVGLNPSFIAFQDIDVSSDYAGRDEMVNLSGQMAVPVLLIDGTVVVGFDKPKIDSLLG